MCKEIIDILRCPLCGTLLYQEGADEPPSWCSHVQCVFHTFPCWVYARSEFLEAYIQSLKSGAGAEDRFGDEDEIDEEQMLRLADEDRFGDIKLPWLRNVATAICSADAQVFMIPETYDCTYIITSSGLAK